MSFGSISCNKSMANGLSFSLGWGIVSCFELYCIKSYNKISMSINLELYVPPTVFVV